ncbi:hypothetical protein MAH1_33610 [Sessilibacter sp. MAH1]
MSLRNPKIKLTIIRRKDAAARLGAKSTWFHERVKAGLIPPPINLGLRAKGFVEHELDQVLAFMVAGKSNAEIKILVDHQVKQRQKLLEGTGYELITPTDD